MALVGTGVTTFSLPLTKPRPAAPGPWGPDRPGAPSAWGAAGSVRGARRSRSSAMAGEGTKLARELNIWEAIGISVALMAPSMAANINPQGMVGVVGRAIPLTFALATVGVLLVAYTF